MGRLRRAMDWLVAQSGYVEPDRTPRQGTNCRCPDCGLTQMVDFSRWCTGCRRAMFVPADAVGPREQWAS